MHLQIHPEYHDVMHAMSASKSSSCCRCMTGQTLQADNVILSLAQDTVKLLKHQDTWQAGLALYLKSKLDNVLHFIRAALHIEYAKART